MKKCLNFLYVLILLSSFVYANDNNRAQSSSRAMSQELMEKIIKHRSEELSFLNNLNNNNNWPNQNYIPPAYLPQGYHNITSSSLYGTSVVIEDGSVWNVKMGYFEEARCWGVNDSILIIPNNNWFNWFNDYNYKMFNESRNTYIEVKNHLGPELDNSYTLLITAINRNEIILSDGSHWSIHKSDQYITEDWFLEDAIVIGTNPNNRWYTNYPSNVLIDINKIGHPYIRATQTQ